MRSGLGCLVLTASLACGCGSDGGGANQGPDLPLELGDAGESADAASVDADGKVDDAGSKPVVRHDASATTDGALTEDNACAATTVAAEKVVVTEEVQVEVVTETPAPVALYVMFDRSQSMGSLWTPARTAIKSFVNDSGSAGIDVALQYFPISGGECGGGGYSTPSVALGRLPARAAGIASSLDGQSASGFGTPMEGALKGATAFCKTFQAAHADEKCIAVLVTDGRPQISCEQDDDAIVAIAKDAWDKSGVRTFAVGLQGADFTLLDRIAKAGNAADCDTTKNAWACDVSGGADKLSVALGKIRDSVKTVTTKTELVTKTTERPLECQWVMPTPAAGETLDKERVNVTLNGSAGSLPLGRVPSADKCQDAAWYFDNNDAPTQIVACPSTCDAIKATTYSDVKILLGCETKYLVVL
ncbi:MAG TPA: vWA domain-containing protein [Polyangiales bacterium]|nr:vWA domain-containing protein [Polyangiales bacterium]